VSFGHHGPIEIADVQVSLIQNTFVAAPIAGVVADVMVAEGDQVAVQTPLVQLDSEQAKTELEAAQAAYEAARLEGENDVDARYAKRTLEVRQRELQQSEIANRQFPGSVSQTEIAKLQLVVDQSRLAIEQAEHELLVARATAREKLATARIVQTRLEKHGVKAPVSGYVTEVAVEPGEWVEAGKPIVRIISLDPIRVECFVDGRLHGPELVGRRIEFFPARGDAPRDGGDQAKPLTGQVTFVSPELNPVTGQIRLWATIDNPNLTARAGMRGRIVIQQAK
jgi:macrolide-specific efflux system membrane fusion protein